MEQAHIIRHATRHSPVERRLVVVILVEVITVLRGLGSVKEAVGVSRRVRHTCGVSCRNEGNDDCAHCSDSIAAGRYGNLLPGRSGLGRVDFGLGSLASYRAGCLRRHLFTVIRDLVHQAAPSNRPGSQDDTTAFHSSTPTLWVIRLVRHHLVRSSRSCLFCYPTLEWNLPFRADGWHSQCSDDLRGVPSPAAFAIPSNNIPGLPAAHERRTHRA